MITNDLGGWGTSENLEFCDVVGCTVMKFLRCRGTRRLYGLKWLLCEARPSKGCIMLEGVGYCQK